METPTLEKKKKQGQRARERSLSGMRKRSEVDNQKKTYQSTDSVAVLGLVTRPNTVTLSAL
jgi:hypothetical protein